MAITIALSMVGFFFIYKLFSKVICPWNRKRMDENRRKARERLLFGHTRQTRSNPDEEAARPAGDSTQSDYGTTQSVNSNARSNDGTAPTVSDTARPATGTNVTPSAPEMPVVTNIPRALPRYRDVAFTDNELMEDPPSYDDVLRNDRGLTQVRRQVQLQRQASVNE